MTAAKVVPAPRLDAISAVKIAISAAFAVLMKIPLLLATWLHALRFPRKKYVCTEPGRSSCVDAIKYGAIPGSRAT
jgi:hypothetical protein